MEQQTTNYSALIKLNNFYLRLSFIVRKLLLHSESRLACEEHYS